MYVEKQAAKYGEPITMMMCFINLAVHAYNTMEIQIRRNKIKKLNVCSEKERIKETQRKSK